MRLIDSDKLIEKINNFHIADARCVTVMNGVANLIKEQPTAYSVDKVVEELEKELEAGNIAIDYGEFRLFEIVKQGGVSDDCCEWESDYGFISDKHKRETQCGYTFYDLHHAVAFKYCPYCGKKILCKDV